MAHVPYILARTLKDAHAFARDELGLGRGRYRVVNHPGTLKSVPGAELHLVPGWETRFDRFAMKGALRYTRMNVITPEMREAEEPSVPDDLDPPGEQLLIPVSDEEAADFILLHKLESAVAAAPVDSWDAISADMAPDLEAAKRAVESEGLALARADRDDALADAPPAEKPKRRRRSRCKDCGELHFPADGCQTAIEA